MRSKVSRWGNTRGKMSRWGNKGGAKCPGGATLEGQNVQVEQHVKGKLPK